MEYTITFHIDPNLCRQFDEVEAKYQHIRTRNIYSILEFIRPYFRFRSSLRVTDCAIIITTDLIARNNEDIDYVQINVNASYRWN